MYAFALAMCALRLSGVMMARWNFDECVNKNLMAQSMKCFGPEYTKILCSYNLPSNTTTHNASYRLMFYFEDATSIKECTEQKEVVTASGRTQIQWLVREVYYFTSFFFLLQSKVKGSSWNSLHCDNMFADQRFELNGLQWLNVTPTGEQGWLSMHWQSLQSFPLYVEYQLEYWTNGSKQSQVQIQIRSFSGIQNVNESAWWTDALYRVPSSFKSDTTTELFNNLIVPLQLNNQVIILSKLNRILFKRLLKTTQNSAEVECQFLDVPYNLHVRARPVPTKMFSGSWGPWSPVAQAMPALVTGNVSMRCFTRDLQQVTCEWTGSNRDLLSNTTFVLSHWSRSMNATCVDVENLSSEDLVTYRCEFGSPAAENISVTLRAENWRGWYSVSHRPFVLHQVVEPAAPINVNAAPGPNSLELVVTWSVPILALQYLLQYEIRYSEYGNNIWKLIQVKENSSSLRLQDMLANKTYRVQIRAAPDTPELQGSWGPWSTTAVAKASSMHRCTGTTCQESYPSGWNLVSKSAGPRYHTVA